jgi:hypothetical protein
LQGGHAGGAAGAICRILHRPEAEARWLERKVKILPGFDEMDKEIEKLFSGEIDEVI